MPFLTTYVDLFPFLHLMHVHKFTQHLICSHISPHWGTQAQEVWAWSFDLASVYLQCTRSIWSVYEFTKSPARSVICLFSLGFPLRLSVGSCPFRFPATWCWMLNSHPKRVGEGWTGWYSLNRGLTNFLCLKNSQNRQIWGLKPRSEFWFYIRIQ